MNKWGQTPINLSALHNQIGFTGPQFGKDGRIPGPSQLLHVTDLACYSATCNDFPGEFMASSVAARVQKRRLAMRMAGLRPVQIWVPDTRQPGFAQECRRQSQIASQVDVADADMERFMDAALADVDGWTD